MISVCSFVTTFCALVLFVRYVRDMATDREMVVWHFAWSLVLSAVIVLCSFWCAAALSAEGVEW